MGLVSLKTVLDQCDKKAVPAFDAIDQISVDALINASEKTNSPIILMVPEAALPLVDFELISNYIITRVKDAKTDICVMLDHGQSFDVVMKAIHLGYSAVMIDGSQLSFDENLKLTKKVVEIAHAAGVSVEAEIGHVSGGEGNMTEGSEVDKSQYTDPQMAVSFAKETNVDALAVAFGTVHGVYKGDPKLDLELLAEIESKIEVPLVMHGGSGLPHEQMVDAVRGGIKKINIFTEISMEATRYIHEYAKSKEDKAHFAELLLVTKMHTEEIAKNYIELFNDK